MSKYDKIKFLKETKARTLHICDKCDRVINKGEKYYPESIGKINKCGIKLKKYCIECFHNYGNNLIEDK